MDEKQEVVRMGQVALGRTRTKKRNEYMDVTRERWESLDPVTHRSKIDNIMDTLYLNVMKKGCTKSADLILKRLYGKEREYVEMNLHRTDENISTVQISSIDDRMNQIKESIELIQSGSGDSVLVSTGDNIGKSMEVVQEIKKGEEAIKNANNERIGIPIEDV